jgi:hypothetical protein
MRQRFPERVLHPKPLTPERQRALSAGVFWKLMDRWQVPNAAALEAIGCPVEGDGTERPDFKLSDDQATFLSCLLEIDLTLTLAEVVRQRAAQRKPIGRTVLGDKGRRCDPSNAAKVLWILKRSAAMSIADRAVEH